MLAASLWVLRVRDWRCYGAAFLWGASFHAVQTGNVTIPLLLLTALAWRAREAHVRAGVWSGLAVATKIICWPLAVWLVSTRRFSAAVVSVIVAGAVTFGLWGLLGFSGLLDYPSSLDKLETAQTGSSYTVRALLEDAGAPRLGQVAWYVLVLGVLAACVLAGRRGDDRLSFSFAVLACVVASPIVWLHSFVLLLAPVALYLPRLSFVWVVPALLWFGSGNGNGRPGRRRSSWGSAQPRLRSPSSAPRTAAPGRRSSRRLDRWESTNASPRTAAELPHRAAGRR